MHRERSFVTRHPTPGAGPVARFSSVASVLVKRSQRLLDRLRLRRLVMHVMPFRVSYLLVDLLAASVRYRLSALGAGTHILHSRSRLIPESLVYIRLL